MKCIYIRQYQTNFELPKKSAIPSRKYCNYKYQLYGAEANFYTSQIVWWAYDLPDGFCRFLPLPIQSEKIFSNPAIPWAKRPNHFALLAEREKTTTIPQRKGVRRWELSPALAGQASLTAIASWYWNTKPLTICGK